MEMLTAQGMRMPKLGLGTWPMKGKECQVAVERALALGYRHIDTAQSYGNEDAVGAALAATGVKREDIHVTTKVWLDKLTPSLMRRAMAESLTALRSDYVDLYLIHWPTEDGLDAALETLGRLHAEKLARAIGVSNFPVKLMRQAVSDRRLPIACNQVEYHVMLDQSAVLAQARRDGMVVTAYSPVAKNRVADDPEMQRIARKHDATPAQIALKWLLDQENVAAVPKAASEANQKANLAALDISLDDEDRAAIGKLPKNRRLVVPSWAPAWDS
jgi:2,5-diketo-D-gluconate reductase B